MDTHHWAWGTECVCVRLVFSPECNLISPDSERLLVYSISCEPRYDGSQLDWRQDEGTIRVAKTRRRRKKKDCNETVSWNTSYNPDLQFKESDLRCLRCEGLTPEVTHLHGKLLSINWWGGKKRQKNQPSIHPSIHRLSVTSYPFKGHGWSRVQLGHNLDRSPDQNQPVLLIDFSVARLWQHILKIWLFLLVKRNTGFKPTSMSQICDEDDDWRLQKKKSAAPLLTQPPAAEDDHSSLGTIGKTRPWCSENTRALIFLPPLRPSSAHKWLFCSVDSTWP